MGAYIFVRPWAKPFICNTGNSHSNHPGQALLLAPFGRWENWRLESLCNFPKVTRLESGRARVWTRVSVSDSRHSALNHFASPLRTSKLIILGVWVCPVLKGTLQHLRPTCSQYSFHPGSREQRRPSAWSPWRTGSPRSSMAAPGCINMNQKKVRKIPYQDSKSPGDSFPFQLQSDPVLVCKVK